MDAKYRQLADELKRQIQNHHFAVGDKLPGLREFSEQKAVSIATALAAYRQLENDGFVEARHRSGYFVRPLYKNDKGQPPTTLTPAVVTQQDMIMRMVRAVHAPHCINFGSALPGEMYQPSKAIRKSSIHVAKTHQRHHRYEASAGAYELRVQIARRMAEAGYISGADNILVTNGCQEALLIALKTVTSPGHIVAVESPTFYGLLQVIESLGLKAIEIPTSPEHGISLDALAFALENWPISTCIVSPNVNNPLGYVMSDDHKKKLVSLAASRNVTLIEDDIYGDLVYAPKRPSCLLSLAPEADIIYCSSFSKSIAPDFRVGWLIGPKYRESFERTKFNLNIASSSLLQHTVADIIATGSYDRHLRRVRRDYARARDRMRTALERYFPSVTTLSSPVGGFSYWITLPDSVNTSVLAQDALKKDIAIAPGELFSASGKYKNALRLTYSGDWNHRTELALKTLGELIHRSIEQTLVKSDMDANVVSLNANPTYLRTKR